MSASTEKKKKRGLFGKMFKGKASKKTSGTSSKSTTASTTAARGPPRAVVKRQPTPPPPPPPAPKPKGWLSRSKYFRQMTDNAFELVDQDGSGEVDEKELYSGLLLIHLKLGSYAGPAACKPVDREKVHAVFKKMDHDNSGYLDREEFRDVMVVLCGNVFTRVMAQWGLTLLVVPLLAQFLLDGVIFLVKFIWGQLENVEGVDLFLDTMHDQANDYANQALAMIPPSMLGPLTKAYDFVVDAIEKVPESVWETIPVTLISCVLGIILVPYTIFKVDEFFQNMADSSKKENEKLKSGRSVAPPTKSGGKGRASI